MVTFIFTETLQTTGDTCFRIAEAVPLKKREIKRTVFSYYRPLLISLERALPWIPG